MESPVAENREINWWIKETNLDGEDMDREYNGHFIRQHLCECLESGKVVANFPSSIKKTKR